MRIANVSLLSLLSLLASNNPGCSAFTPRSSQALSPSASSSTKNISNTQIQAICCASSGGSCCSNKNKNKNKANGNENNNNSNANDIPSSVSARQARIVAPMKVAATAAAASATAATASPHEALAANVLPPYSPDFETSARTFFPGAVPQSVILPRIVKKLTSRGYRPYNTILGSSLCCDEVCSTGQALVQTLQKALSLKEGGGVFNLGGLGAVPFAGKTGFGAFLSHAPEENGKVVIFYAPHVGITSEGVIGKVERVGQSKPSLCCGASGGAFKVIKAGGRGEVNDKFDYQEEWLIDELEPKLRPILEQQKMSGALNGFVSNNSAFASLNCIMFDIVNDVMEEQLERFFDDPKFWNKVNEVTLIGGIILNRGRGNGLPLAAEDYFQPLQFKAVNKNGEVDMWDQTFGDLQSRSYAIRQG